MMIPISLAVTLLQHYGAIAFAARYIDPLFRLMGLPGESAVVFITGAALTTYAAVAVLLSLTLTLRQATIISLMVLLCHALPMECTVTRRTGSSFAGMVVLRILMAFAAAFYLNLILPEMPQTFGFATVPHAETTLAEVAENWFVSNLKLSVMIFLIIYSIMIMQNMLQAFNMLDAISKFLRPLMRFFGLPEDAAYFWLVGNTLGISYGGAVMFDCIENGTIPREKAAAVNRHLAMNHSIIEDTCVFGAIGISVFWIISTRMLFALIVVWGRKLMMKIFRKTRKTTAN